MTISTQFLPKAENEKRVPNPYHRLLRPRRTPSDRSLKEAKFGELLLAGGGLRTNKVQTLPLLLQLLHSPPKIRIKFCEGGRERERELMDNFKDNLNITVV